MGYWASSASARLLELRRSAATLLLGDALLDVYGWEMPIVAVLKHGEHVELSCLHPSDRGIVPIKYESHHDVSTMRMP